MSWTPANVSYMCTDNSTFTSCQPSFIAYHGIVTSLFGYSKDGTFNCLNIMHFQWNISERFWHFQIIWIDFINNKDSNEQK